MSRRLLAVLAALAAFLVVAVGWRACQPTAETLPAATVVGAPVPAGALRVMTWNLAHGRGTAFNQAFLSRARIAENLGEIAAVLAREQPSVVALQEADGPSLWSGHFDHVQSLAAAGGFTAAFRGAHVQGFGPLRLDYGTALLARLPLAETHSQVFRKAAWDTKGFVWATVHPASLAGVAVVVVAVHLDFASAEVRAAQVEDLIAALRPLPPPLVVLGDFNCGLDEPGCVSALPAALSLSVAAPVAAAGTFPCAAPRLSIDWILTSPALVAKTQHVLPDVLSDHCAVIADLVLRPQVPTTDSR